MTRLANKQILKYLFFLILLTTSLPSRAVIIEEILPDGLHVTADFRQGDTDKPAILFLHGFMTVHTFSLIQKITDELNDNDFTILSPTLSLGISKRKSTLACDALHLHSMQNDIKEIDFWFQWLISKGYKRIILMGHSTGAMQIIHYANIYDHKEIAQVLGISLVPLGRRDLPKLQSSINKARQLVRNKDKKIHNFTIAYCDENYSSPAVDYLSYAEWDSRRILDTIKNLNKTATIIMGGADDSVYPDWNKEMINTGAKVIIIDGANHFFSQGQKFELFDILNSQLDHQ